MAARPRRTEASLRRQTAFHEAGHAVVGWAVGREVGEVRILGNGDGGADVDVITGEIPAADRIAIAWAGTIAGNLCGEPRAEPRPYSSDRVDAYNAEARAFPDDDDAQRRLGRRGQAKARRLLHRHWPLVDRLASELNRRGLVSMAEVRLLLAAEPERT